MKLTSERGHKSLDSENNSPVQTNWARQALILLPTLGLFIAAGIAVVACDGSDIEATFDAGTGNTGGGFLPVGGTGGRVRDFDGGVVSRPPPPINPASLKLLSGRVSLVGSHSSACSNGEPAPGQPQGDRWCGFFRPGEGFGRFELWVFNLTQAAATNTPPVCDGTQPATCRRLTDNLWTGRPNVGPAHPFAHGFDGDTLIFHANARSEPDELYRGPVYAWRPGWAEARQISSSDGILCNGSPRAAVAVCLDNIEPDPTRPLEFDLLAGPISDTPSTQLPRVDRIFALNADDVSKWSSGFSRDGSLFAYSTGRTASNTDEVLRIMRTDATGTFNPAVAGVEQASRFRFARDGKRVFYLTNFNYSTERSPAGRLMVAPIEIAGDGTPSIGAGTLVEDNVGAYLVLGEDDVDEGIGYFRDVATGRGTLNLIPDVANPQLRKVIQRNIASALFSPDGRYLFFSRAIDDNGGVSDALIANIETAELGTNPTIAPSCVLQSALRTDIYGQPFLESGGMVFFADSVDTELLVGMGTSADPATCQSQNPFAPRMDYWFPVGDEGLVYSDNADREVADLRYVEIEDGVRFKPGSSTLIQQQAFFIYSFSQPEFDGIVYQIDTSSQVDGIYLFKTPFPLGPGATDAGAVDAGVVDAGSDAG